MAGENKAVAAGAENGAAPKKSPLKLILIIGMVLVLGAGGFIGWQMFSKGKKADTPAGVEAIPERLTEGMSIMCPLKSFIVNLADKSGLGRRYLKITMELEVASEKGKELVDKQTAKLRDSILFVLSSLSYDEINSTGGKMRLKRSLLSRIKQTLGADVVRKVYFVEFVVQ